MKNLLALILALCGAVPVTAHPHIFVDTGLDLHFDDDGRLTEVRVTWAYDEFYSLLITEDRGLDQDFDGKMTPEELADLQGFDMQWTPGFNGDLVVMQDGQNLTLSAPLEATAVYEDSRITTTHVRRVDQAQSGRGVIEIKPYDPTYYTAYDISLPVRLEGNPACKESIDVPDVAARLQELGDQLAAMEDMSDDDLPDVGILLASTVTVTCDIS
ncbi:DUF1007 family protein [Sulfitobacter sp. F26204]|uniref:DUF1007 family protein n=1 Tax=Sulfitobacter sp. F26204 TaxID=2996014 RepID=UPI00225DF6AB|nr:DUF1007 family protein [Sulfitobacter sp. F26204]MCX7558089.1 DUF1007 family protein [Sulfitobacter sp. F26204]